MKLGEYFAKQSETSKIRKFTKKKVNYHRINTVRPYPAHYYAVINIAGIFTKSH